MTRHRLPRPAACEPVSPLPIFIIASQPDGSLRVCKLSSGEGGQSLMARLRQDARFSRVWLAKAFQGAAASAHDGSAE